MKAVSGSSVLKNCQAFVGHFYSGRRTKNLASCISSVEQARLEQQKSTSWNRAHLAVSHKSRLTIRWIASPTKSSSLDSRMRPNGDILKCSSSNSPPGSAASRRSLSQQNRQSLCRRRSNSTGRRFKAARNWSKLQSHSSSMVS
uniref:Uncharacterized protein n=1 Tax=Macrostomum lignano TaxID=282301 RepID=A0A1I8GZ42_9PLAT